VPKRSKDHDLASAPTIDVAPADGAVEVAPEDLLALPIDSRYLIGSELGRGGMGEIHECEDRRIGRNVAMKTLSSSRDSAVERFVREVRVQGQLEHPAIVPVYDLGVHEDGRPFFTMKRLRGKTFREIIHGYREDDRDVIANYPRRRLLSDLALVSLAVDFAHRRGIVHRDIKPENIMVGDFGEVYVLDWGIAREGTEAPTGETAVPGKGVTPSSTLSGTVLGTPGYMAPEQVRGDLEEIDARTDVYALGAVLFELLTGHDLNQGQDVNDILAETLTGVDARATARFPDLDIAPELELACMQAVATKKMDRFQSARELHDRIEAYLDGDRDLERRRQQADHHAKNARKALDGGNDLADRAVAMREAGRALALDPAHQEAATIVTKLLLEPPDAEPREIGEQISQNQHENTRALTRAASWMLSGLLVITPFLWWSGDTNLSVALVMTGLLAAMTAETFFSARAKRPRAWSLHLLMYLNAAFLVVLGLLVSPLVLVPAAAAFTSAAFLMHYHLRPRWLITLLGVLVVIGPLALEWLGVLAPSYRFENGNLVLMSRAINLETSPTVLVLTATSTLLIITTSVFVNKLRNHQLDAERKLLLQAWHLKKALPTSSSKPKSDS
jgi:serine/threonine-protein kinase